MLPQGIGTGIAISPDGQALVFVGHGPSGRQLYLHRMDEFGATPISGTTGASMPFLSPDGQWVGFERTGSLMRVPISGGEPFTLCSRCDYGFWGEDGNIIFSWDGTVWQVPIEGEPEVLAAPMPDLGVPGMSRPVLLPGGRTLLFETGPGGFGQVGVLSLERNEVTVVSVDGQDPFYSASGHILFARGSSLFAAPFDIEAFEVTGPAAPVVQGVRVESGGALQAAISDEGLLVYAPASGARGVELAWVGRDGTVESVLEAPQVFREPRLSPDGERLAVVATDEGASDIWIREVESGSLRRLTTLGTAGTPRWTPDGARVTFGAGTAGAYAIQSVAVDGSVEVETLIESAFPVFPEAWAPNGFQLVFREDSPSSDLFVTDVRDEGSRAPLLVSDSRAFSATLSRAGDWLAYVSDRSGSMEVYVRPFPGPGNDYLVSSGGGIEPVWGSDGTEIFYRTSDWISQMVASIRTEPFTVKRDVLFESPNFWTGGYEGTQYDLHQDGQRFLMMSMRAVEGVRSNLHAVINWHAELERLVPTN